jgi:hypothetical protein
MTPFWKTWMTATCATLGLLGLILAGGAIEATEGAARLYFDIINGPGDLNLDAHMRVSLAVLGGVCVGWSITLLATFQAAHALKGAAAASVWRLTVFGLITWYVIDSTLSVMTGFWINGAVNTLFFLALLTPIIRSGVLKNA